MSFKNSLKKLEIQPIQTVVLPKFLVQTTCGKTNKPNTDPITHFFHFHFNEKTLMTTRMNWTRMRTKSIGGCDLGCPWQATLMTERDLPWPEGTLTDPGLQTATDVWRRCLRRSWGDSSFAGCKMKKVANGIFYTIRRME